MHKSGIHKENSRHGKQLTAAVLAAGYFIIVFLGCFIIWAIPVIKNRDDLLTIAAEKGQSVLAIGQDDEVLLYGMEHWFYDERGRIISAETAFLHKSQQEEIREYANDVLENGTVFVPVWFLLDNRDDEPAHAFGIIAGVSVESVGGKPFASILLRDMPDLETTMVTYVVLFTIVYLVGCYFVVTTLKKERKLRQVQRDLIANVSHELKTPITAIRAMAETLHDGMIEDHQTKHLYSGQIIAEADQLEQLVLDILELSKLQSHRAQFEQSGIYADGLIPPIVDRYMMLCGDMGITLDASQLDLDDIPRLYTDVDKIITLFSILLDNAVKFTGPGGTIWITQQIHSKYAVFCVRDNGPGIRSEDIDRIFERFFKADLSHNSSGSGLGLAIATEIVKGLGEKLWVESKYGEGTAFYFTIGFK